MNTRWQPPILPASGRGDGQHAPRPTYAFKLFHPLYHDGLLVTKGNGWTRVQAAHFIPHNGESK
jgi:hypothetical protein